MAMEEFQSLHGALAAWGNAQHDDDGNHTDVTAQSVMLDKARSVALKIVAGWMDAGGGVAYSGAITPPEITDPTLENYCPLGIDEAFMLRLSTSVPVAIGGIKDGARVVPLDGRVLALFNAGSVDISLTHEELASTAEYRFRLPGFLNVHIPPNNFALLYYDAKSRRWVLLSSSTGTGGVASSEYNAGSSGANITVDWANATQQIITLTSNANITLVNGVEGQLYRLILIEGGGGGFQPNFVSPTVTFENDTLKTSATAVGEILQVSLYFSLLGPQYFAAYTTPELELGIDASDLTLADDTTNNVTDAAHGFAPKSPGDADTFLNGASTPDYTTPRFSRPVSVDATPDTVANTAAETAFAPDYTAAADDLEVGDVLRVTLRGAFGTDATPPTLQLIGYLNAVAVFDTTALTLPTGGLVDAGWVTSFDVIVTADGVSGSVEVQGQVLLDELSKAIPATADFTVNTTIPQVLTVSVTWGTADTDNTITLRQWSVERLRGA